MLDPLAGHLFQHLIGVGGEPWNAAQSRLKAHAVTIGGNFQIAGDFFGRNEYLVPITGLVSHGLNLTAVFPL